MGWMLIALQMPNTVLQSYSNVSRYGYRVLCTVACGVIVIRRCTNVSFRLYCLVFKSHVHALCIQVIVVKLRVSRSTTVSMVCSMNGWTCRTCNELAPDVSTAHARFSTAW